MKDNSAGFYYDKRNWRTRPAASLIVPIIMDLLSPSSVIDVGCGVGTWLNVFKENGVTKVLGLDAYYVDKEYLQIDASDFIECDLMSPPQLDSKWDLAITLEVAEHLQPEYAENFVKFL